MRPPTILRAFASARALVSRRPGTQPGSSSSDAIPPVRPVPPSPRPPVGDLDSGWYLAVELVTATLVWGGIGWLVDRWLGTGPWLMSLGFVVGNACGIYLVWLKSEQAMAEERRLREARASARTAERVAARAASEAAAVRRG